MSAPDSPTLDTLWESITPGQRCFSFEDIAHLPAQAQRYIAHAIQPGTILATGVRLTMRGEIKLNVWLPFTAEQVSSIVIWKIRVQAGLLPIQGQEQLLAGQGSMVWTLPGRIPLLRAQSEHTTRSLLGRLHGEALWLPPALLRWATLWRELPHLQLAACLSATGGETPLRLQLAEQGQVRALQYQRWGEQACSPSANHYFGGLLSEEKTFQGYTIPTRMRLGWDYAWEYADTWLGEFLRATITGAEFR